MNGTNVVLLPSHHLHCFQARRLQEFASPSELGVHDTEPGLRTAPRVPSACGFLASQND